jgi:hypothetical protein
VTIFRCSREGADPVVKGAPQYGQKAKSPSSCLPHVAQVTTQRV